VGSYPSQTTNLYETLLVPEDYSTYLVAMTLVPHSSLDAVKATLNWIDDYSSHVLSIGSCSGCAPQYVVFPIRCARGLGLSLFTSGTVSDKFDLYIRGLKFGTPAQGSGPISFYGRTFLDWVNPVNYDEGVVPAGMWVMAATGEYASAERRLTLNGFPVSATTGTVPAVSGLAAAYQPSAAREWFYTICGSYECPEYSAEFNLFVF
jgi:hypothetical protein